MRYVVITGSACAPSSAPMRVRRPASSSENSAGAALEVSSVRVDPSISGTDGDTVDAVGWNG